MRKNVIVFLSISLNVCFCCTKTSHLDVSFEYPQDKPKHKFWLRNVKVNGS